MSKPTKADSGLWSVDVDGKNYEFEKWGAEEAIETLVDIGGIIGGPIGTSIAAAFSGKGNALQEDVPDAVAGNVIGELAKNMRADKAGVMAVLKKLCAGRVFCGGKRVVFDTSYDATDLPHIFRVCKAAIEVQYGSFSAAGAALKDMLPQAPA